MQNDEDADSARQMVMVSYMIVQMRTNERTTAMRTAYITC